jgi:hypothetical protein
MLFLGGIRPKFYRRKFIRKCFRPKWSFVTSIPGPVSRVLRQDPLEEEALRIVGAVREVAAIWRQ